jgi:hypothetical protein
MIGLYLQDNCLIHFSRPRLFVSTPQGGELGQVVDR